MRPAAVADKAHVETTLDSSLIRPAAGLWLARALSFPSVVAALFASLVYCMTPASMADPDIWWHLRNAEEQLHTHRFLTSDLYSFSAAGAPWIDHEWLAELPFYFGYRTVGERGVMLVTALVIQAIMLGVFYLAHRRSQSLAVAGGASVVAALLATVSFGPRTLLFGWLCLVVELIVFEHFQSDERAAWCLPPLFAVWVNLHGSWVIGMVLLLVFVGCGCVRMQAGAIDNSAWTRPQRHRLAAIAGLSVAALFVNPYGWRLVAYPFDLAFHQTLNIANVEEWRSLDFHGLRGRVFLGCVAGIFAMQLLRPRKWRLQEAAFLAIGIYSAACYSRFLFLAAILVMPLAAGCVPAGRASQRRERPLLNAVLLLAITLLIVSRVHVHAAGVKAEESRYPVQALGYLHGFQPQGNVFNEYTWGGFLIFHARQIPVAIDPRADIFERSGMFQDYLDAVHLKDPDAVLHKYKIRYVLFERDAPLTLFLMQTSAWKVDYEDRTTVLLERTTALDESL